jgi:Protein of Unknown function (DUF2784)
MNFYSFLADVTVVLHGAYVAFVLLGLLAVMLGFLLRWEWVRNFWFRIVHLAMILVVAFEAMMGIVCPLTTLENSLRSKAGESVRDGSFMGQVVHDLLFCDVQPWVFTCGYCTFATLVLLSFVIVPPNRKSVPSVPS